MPTEDAAPELPLTQRLQLEVHRKMLWLQCSLFMAMGFGYVAFLLVSVYPRFPWVSAFIGLSSLALLAFGTRSRRYRLALDIHNVCLFGAYAFASSLQQGLYSSALWWLVLPPVLAVLAGSLRLGAVLFVALLAQTLWLAQVGPRSLGSVVLTLGSGHTQMAVAVIGSSLVLGLAACLGALWVGRLLDELAAATHAAKEAEAVKARFLANMSHEIRTPLGGLIGAGELLLSPHIDAARRRHLLGLQQHSAQALLALVNDLLDFSKLEAGKVALEIRPTRLRALVFEANELFATQAHGKGIELSSSCSPGVPRRFLCDPTRLRQIVGNLVGNAVKFTTRGGVHLHLELDAGAAAHDPLRPGWHWVRIEVTDSGIGIADDVLPGLFEAFRQADESVTRRYGGTGLGLAICRDLARLMGGRIDVTSVPGQGSTFTLRLPLQALPEPVAAPRRAPAAVPRLHVAAADAGLRRHLGALLEELGQPFEIDAALPAPGTLAADTVLLLDAALLAGAPDLQARLAAGARPCRRLVLVEPLGSDLMAGALPDVQRLFKPVRLKALQAVLHAAAAPAHAAAPAPAGAAPDGIDARVLVVEDNPVNQVVVQAMLAELGARCELADNGLVALERLESDRYDLVLMDMQMPELDGLGATRRLRERENGAARVPVIAMTASTERADLDAMRDAGADGHLAKPFGIAQLRRCLEQWRP